MAKFGVNTPPGLPAFTLSEVDAAAEKMQVDGEVRMVSPPMSMHANSSNPVS